MQKTGSFAAAASSSDGQMNTKKQTATILVTMIILVSLACSEPLVHLGGTDGAKLLGVLTNGTLNNSSNDSILINLSQNSTAIMLGGNNGTQLLNNITANLSDWGSKPPTAPRPPKYDPKMTKMIAVIRTNHIGY
jgi:hypothetical protein